MELAFFYPLIGVLASLLGAYISFRYYVYYHSQGYAQAGDQGLTRRRENRALLFLLISTAIFTVSSAYLFALSKTAQVPSIAQTLTPGEGAGAPLPGTDQASPIAGTPPLLMTITPPQSAATQTAAPVTGIARIGNTNSFGANVRSEPGLNFESLTQLSDGSRVELTGQAQSVDGFNWQRVRLEDGRIGWIADKFLIPEP